MPKSRPMTHQEAGRLGAMRKLSQRPDKAADTAAAREAFLDKLQAHLEAEVDPEGQYDTATRAELAEYRRKEYFQRLAIRSAQARAAKKAGRDGTA
jgi:hypothetical protein